MRESVRTCLQFLLLIVLVASAAHLLRAQAGQSELSGYVKDPVGAVIPGAAVVLTETSTGRTAMTTTGPDGLYVFTNKTPGNYSVKFSSTGFDTFTGNVRLLTGEKIRYDISLEVSGPAIHDFDIQPDAPLL